MTLSVLYKTHDEARLPWLRESIGAVKSQTEPTEIVVMVPNGSGLAEQLPDRIDTVIELDDGRLTRARNVAAHASTGESIAFMDDDAYPAPGWAASILDGFDDSDIVGGPLKPDWREPRIEWLPPAWHWLIGCGPYYDSEQIVPNTYGSNFAISRDMFEAVGGFDESIGMGSAGVQQGAETDLARRAREIGGRGVLYLPDAVVHHVIHGRSSVRSLHSRAFGQGRAKAVLGVNDRESAFVRQELQQLDGRDWRQLIATVTLTASVGAGYVTGRLLRRISNRRASQTGADAALDS